MKFRTDVNYLFYVGEDKAYDWGHFMRATHQRWTWAARILSWNPCNHIGQLYGYRS